MRTSLVAFRELWLTLALLVLGLGSILIFGRNGWRDWEPNGGLAVARFFCESLRDGAVRQPINAWSNSGFMLVALIIAYRIGRDGRTGTTGMRATRAVPALYAVLVALLGVGSMFLHASWTRWGGVIDVASMLIFATFLVAHGLARRSGPGQFGAVYVLVTAPTLTFYLVTLQRSTLLFAGLLAVFMLQELLSGRRVVADRRWLAAGTGCFLLGFAVWLPSQNTGPLCCPTCLLQGHAIWHLLCAAATWCLFCYFRSEE